ncbi:hypothetical protein EGW08_021404 [Elysia chlorotica]|uniref:Death domain-containing protein n=1 Tax=Elysia chlorotica TaxID=188477 RepID=A0A3S1AXG5_ELYCH|nr:hypothetical protein EGW08_021404 [Elysia chlorotica]
MHRAQEHLSPACIQTLALNYILQGPSDSEGVQLQSNKSQPTWCSFTTAFSTAPPDRFEPSLRDRVLSPGQKSCRPTLDYQCHKYSGNLQIHISGEVGMGEAPGQAMADQAAANPERDAHMRMMDTEVIHLKFISQELQDIYEYLTANDDWEVLAGHFGLCYRKVQMFRGILQSRPGTPTGQTFLETYMGRYDLSVRVLLRALLNMHRDVYHQLARRLWTAALLNNSPYYLNLRGDH